MKPRFGNIERLRTARKDASRRDNEIQGTVGLVLANEEKDELYE